MSFRQLTRDTPESGGLLLGFVDIESEGLLVEDLTHPTAGDRQSRFGFFRGKRHQKRAVSWNTETAGRGTQLGLWHTHPEQTPVPSNTDRMDVKNFLQKGSFEVDTLVYLIVGISKTGVWLASKDGELTLIGYAE